jgi:serine protease DegS
MLLFSEIILKTVSHLNFLNSIKYIIRPASYGVIIGIALLLLVPELRQNTLDNLNAFNKGNQRQEPLSYAKAVQAAAPAVVNIYSEDIQSRSDYGIAPRKSTRLGSGVIMDASGYILTNYHVVQDADIITVLVQSGQQLSAELIGFDKYTDLAVLKVETTSLPVIPQISGQTPFAGDIVLAIGNPFNLGQTVTQGIISATGRSSLSTVSYLEFLQMDAAINEGNSGGALINTNGELVGINSRKFTNPKMNIQGIFFAVPYQLAHKVMQKIITHGRVTRGYLGVRANTLRAGAKGFEVGSITPNSPAHIAGLQAGDIVYQIAETTITSVPQALDLIAETPPKTTLIFKIYRKHQQFDISVTILEIK